MKRKDKDALSNLSVEELETKLRDIREKQFKAEFQHKTVAAANPLQIRNMRRDAARIRTYIRAKQLAGKKEKA